MSLFAELKRRNVIRVAAAYLVFSWLVLQIADVLFTAGALLPFAVVVVCAVIGLVKR